MKLLAISASLLVVAAVSAADITTTTGSLTAVKASSIGFDIIIKDGKTAGTKFAEWCKAFPAKKCAEVHVDLDGTQRDMTYAEFKERLLGPSPDDVQGYHDRVVQIACQMANTLHETEAELPEACKAH